jgi:ribokinase
LLRLTDILVPNAIEAEALTGAPVRTVDDALAAADALRERGPRTVVITLGERGAVAVAPDLRLHVPAFDAGVLDTVGAGDAFCAALAVSIAEGASLADAVRFANGAGALATTRAGAEPAMPRRDEVDALLAKGAPHGIRP